MNTGEMEITLINRKLSRVWPDWTAVRLIGQGAYGAVYEIHRGSGIYEEKAALKILPVSIYAAGIDPLRLRDLTEEEARKYYRQYLDSIRKEIVVMQRLMGNSHIVSYEDYSIQMNDGPFSGDIFIRMELLTSLPDYLQTHKADDRLVLKLGMDIAEGLRDCHKEGILHRDVKPQNIFANKTGSFKIGDFGVSRYAPGTQRALSFKGTIAYMAPEVFYLKGTDERSDLYSLGMVMYQCLNEYRLPFMSQDPGPEDTEKIQQMRFAGKAVPDPAHGSAALKKAVRKALEADPKDRFQTAEEMYRTLKTIYEGGHKNGQNVFLDAADSFYSNAEERTEQLKPDPTTSSLAGFSAEGYAGQIDTEEQAYLPEDPPQTSIEKDLRTGSGIRSELLHTAAKASIIGLIFVGSLLLSYFIYRHIADITDNEEDEDPKGPETVSAEMDIPADAIVHNGHSYYLYDNDCKSWDEVLKFCDLKGGYPVVINDSVENEVMYQYMLDMGREATLIGYTDRDTEGIWKWVEGDDSDFTDWGTNDAGVLEPNSDSPYEDYAQLDIEMHDGYWNDCAFAFETVSFICEWNGTR